MSMCTGEEGKENSFISKRISDEEDTKMLELPIEMIVRKNSQINNHILPAFVFRILDIVIPL